MHRLRGRWGRRLWTSLTPGMLDSCFKTLFLHPCTLCLSSRSMAWTLWHSKSEVGSSRKRIYDNTRLKGCELFPLPSCELLISNCCTLMALIISFSFNLAGFLEKWGLYEKAFRVPACLSFLLPFQYLLNWQEHFSHIWQRTSGFKYMVLRESLGKCGAGRKAETCWRTGRDGSAHSLSAWLSQQPRATAGWAGSSCIAPNHCWWHTVLMAYLIYLEERARCSPEYWGHRGEVRIWYVRDLGKTEGYCCDVVCVWEG